VEENKQEKCTDDKGQQVKAW